MRNTVAYGGISLSWRTCNRLSCRYSGVTREMVVVAVTLRIKTNAARIMPVYTATVRSAKTVRMNVADQQATSSRESLSSSGISVHSPMLYETTSRIAASTDSGMNLATGAANSRIVNNVRA